jgi:hypothetical protein
MPPRLTSTRAGVSTRKTFITCGYFPVDKDLHLRRQLRPARHLGYSYCYTYGDSNSYCYTDSDRNSYTHANGNSEADANTQI